MPAAIAMAGGICYSIINRLDNEKDGTNVRTVNEAARQAKKIELMEKSFACYAENGLTGVGIKTIAAACGCNSATLYQYFDNLDDLIVQATDYCMTKVEDEFMAKAPTDVGDAMRYIEEIPYWTAREHGKKYRLMYQVYTHPKYIEHGKRFFAGLDQRYTAYAKQLAPKLGIPYTTITALICVFVRACVHYALFEDEYYLKGQLELLKQGVALFAGRNHNDFLHGGEKA